MSNVDINLIGDVNSGMLRHLMSELHKIKKEDTVTIHLSTDGGDLHVGLGIYDALKRLDEDVRIIAYGPCMSAGILILQGVKKRYCLPNTQFMVHYGIEFSEGIDDAKHNKSVFSTMKSIVGDRTKVSTRTLNTWFKGGAIYFNGKKALKAGLIDGIIND